MYQQLWGYKVEDKLYLGVREQKRLNATVLQYLKKFNVRTMRCSAHVDTTVNFLPNDAAPGSQLLQHPLECDPVSR
jgi:hypothetical protein